MSFLKYPFLNQGTLEMSVTLNFPCLAKISIFFFTCEKIITKNSSLLVSLNFGIICSRKKEDR